jgi:antitoxin component of MazEF toxin-antitoxin module
MSALEAMKNYIYYTHRPFTSNQIVKELGICYETVKKYLQDFIKVNYIRQIGTDKGKNVYIAVKCRSMGKSYKAKKKHLTLADIQEKYRREQEKQRVDWRETFDGL